MSKNKGFTLIELLLVIAIISLLSSIVTAQLVSSRDKAADAAAKENMINLRSISELYYLDNANNYQNFCQDSDTQAALTAAEGATGFTPDCDVDPSDHQRWAAEVQLKDGNFFCVDTRGGGKVRSLTKGADGYVCQ